MKYGMLLLESSSAPYFIHTLQLIIKDSLFSENNLSVLIAKPSQTFGHFNHSSTVCEKLKKNQVTLGSSVSIQKALLFVQDVETRWNSIYLMLKRLEKLKQVSKTTWLAIYLTPIIFLQPMNGNLLTSKMNCSNHFT